MQLVLLLLSFIAASVAVPTKTIDPYDWNPALGDFYEVVARHISEARQAGVSPPGCDLSNAVMPTAPTPLPSPSGLKLVHVAIGRGTQNYTCAAANPTTTPALVGAMATLYNASCIAANYGDVLARLPNLALQYPVPPEPSSNLEPSNLIVSGHHFFPALKTPEFNITPVSLGIAVGHTVANSTAPVGSPKGEGGFGNGSVAWLYLNMTNATVGDIKAVYRVNTAGGAPPQNCTSSPANFDVQYSAEYWMYVDA